MTIGPDSALLFGGIVRVVVRNPAVAQYRVAVGGNVEPEDLTFITFRLLSVVGPVLVHEVAGSHVADGIKQVINAFMGSDHQASAVVVVAAGDGIADHHFGRQFVLHGVVGKAGEFCPEKASPVGGSATVELK